MKPAVFEYHSPTSVSEAVTLLSEYDHAEVVAGNQSLGIQMSNRLATPDHLIDLNDVDDLFYIDDRDDEIEIGAMTRHADIANSQVLERRLPVLAEAAGEIAGPSVRNMGTIGGSLAEADPAGNYPTVLTALEATISLRGPDGARDIDVSEFYLAYMMTAADEDELITSATITTDPFPPNRTGFAFHEIKRVPHTWPTLSAAAAVRVDDPTAESPEIERARLAFGNADDIPLRATAAESAIEGSAASEAALADAADEAMAAAQPASEMQADAEYKEDQVGVLAQRALSDSYAMAIDN